MHAQTMFQRALDLLEVNRVDDAIPLLEELHQMEPRDARVNFALAMAARDAGDDFRRLELLKKAAQVAKKKALVFEELARAHARVEEEEEAIAAARKAVTLEPKNPDMHAVLGEIYRTMGREKMARQSYERALDLAPDHIFALTEYGELQLSLGETEEAERYFRKATASDNGDSSDAYIPLSELRSRTRDPQDLARLEDEIAKTGNRTQKQTGRLHFAAGAMWDDADDPARAFEHYDRGHAMIYPDYEVDTYKTRIDAMKALFTSSFFEERKELGSDSARPVFIFGMPRSGTTLTEQIINRHQKAAGLGELRYFNQQSQALRFGIGKFRIFEDNVLALGDRDFRRTARKYLALLDKLAPGAERVADKMPHNFEVLWLMALAFPKATFIHCTREPVDCCISIYTKALSSGHRYNRSQTTLGRYYRLYRELMEHWKAVLPVTIHEQSYEAMIADQEGQSRALIARTGLEWDPACLEFYKGERQVRTFSKEQVRKPIYTSSVARWKRYEPHIGPLLDALGDLAPTR
ncbi:tetratricopeptide repeat-containing sulfotransferase family protein [Breoghania corrubedonensis]|nr:sulfotransferase [Breoghania corrubedonensis]